MLQIAVRQSSDSHLFAMLSNLRAAASHRKISTHEPLEPQFFHRGQQPTITLLKEMCLLQDVDFFFAFCQF